MLVVSLHFGLCLFPEQWLSYIWLLLLPGVYLTEFRAMLLDGLSLYLSGYIMNRSLNIMVWNVRGINSQSKWDAIRDKISESSASIVCLQETKRENFDIAYIKKFCPRHLDQFEFSPQWVRLVD